MKHTIKLSQLSFSPSLSAGAFSFLSSLILFALSNSYNSDSIVYLHAADVFSASGWDTAKTIYHRPFYSALIGTFSSLTHLSTVVSAQLVSASLVGLTAFAFVHLLSSLGANTRALRIGAVIICIYPGIASYKDYFIRDFGYWACVLLAISLCISHYRSSKPLDFVLWLSFGALATLFRPEALALVLALFFSSMTIAIKDSKKAIIIQFTIALTGVAGVAIALIALSTTSPLSSIYEHAIYAPEKTLGNLLESWNYVSATLEHEILNRHSREFANLSLVAIYTTIYLSQLANGLSIPFTAGLLYFFYKRQLKLPHAKFILVAATITVLVTATFLISHQFIQTRYLVLLCILLLIPLTFSLAHHSNVFSLKTKKTLIVIAGLIFIDAHVSFGHSKEYISDSVQWIQLNSPRDASIISNDPQISYLSERQYDFKQLNKLRSEKAFDVVKIPSAYDLIAWKSEKGTAPQQSFKIEKSTYKQVIAFSNKRGDRVTIYQKQAL